MLTNRPDIIKKLSVVDGVADNNTILIDINISPKRKCRPKRKIFIRHKADNASILKHFDNFKDEYFKLKGTTTVNDKWNIVNSEVTNIINKYVPHLFTSSRHNLPWFTRILKKLCKRKQRLYIKAKKTRNQHDWQEFCDITKNVHKQLRSARVSHISQFLTTSITDKPKSFWTFTSELRQDNQGIGDLHVSGSIVSADALKAEALNEQFNSVYSIQFNSIQFISSTHQHFIQ